MTMCSRASTAALPFVGFLACQPSAQSPPNGGSTGSMTNADDTGATTDPDGGSTTGAVADGMRFRWLVTTGERVCGVAEPDGRAVCLEASCVDGLDPDQWPLQDEACWGASGLPGGAYAQIEIAPASGNAAVCGILEADGSVVCSDDSSVPVGGDFVDLAYSVSGLFVAVSPERTTDSSGREYPGGLAVEPGVILREEGLCWLPYGTETVSCPTVPGAFASLVGDSLCGISADGDVSCFHYSGDPASHPVQDLGPLAAADVHAAGGCGIHLDGTVTCYGEFPSPAGEFVSISLASIVTTFNPENGEGTEYVHGCGVRPDQSAACWGDARPWCGATLCEYELECVEEQCVQCGPGPCAPCGASYCTAIEVCQEGECVLGCNQSSQCGLDTERCIDGTCQDISLPECDPPLALADVALPAGNEEGSLAVVVDGDGTPDLVIAGRFGVSLRHGPDLAPGIDLLEFAEEAWRIVAAGDIDGDGDDDVVVHAPLLGTTDVLLAGPTWTSPPAFPAFDLPTAVGGSAKLKLADGDGDGFADLYYARSREDEEQDQEFREVLAYRGDGTGVFALFDTIAAPPIGNFFQGDFVVGDLGGAAELDLALPENGGVSITFDPPSGGDLSLPFDPRHIGQAGQSAVASLDLDGDGTRELAQFGSHEATLVLDAWFALQPDDTAVARAIPVTPSWNRTIEAVADLDGDGRDELVLGSESHGLVVVVGGGPPNDPFTCYHEIGTPTPWDVVAADFDGDGADELVMVDSAGDSLYLVEQG